MINVTCSCGATLRVKDEYAGKRGKCPKCGQAILIPEQEIVDLQIAEEVPYAAPAPAYRAEPNPFQPAASAPYSSPPSYPAAQSSPFSNQDFNPYQAPQAPMIGAATTTMILGPHLQLVGDQIVGASPIILPQNCIKCGEGVRPLLDMKQRTVYYTPAWAYLGLLGGVLPLLILVLVTRKACLVTFGLCDAHRKRRFRNLLISNGFLVLSIVLFIIGVSDSRKLPNETLLFGGILMFIGSLIAIGVSAKLLVAKQHNKGVFHIQGFKSGFLSKLRM